MKGIKCSLSTFHHSPESTMFLQKLSSKENVENALYQAAHERYKREQAMLPYEVFDALAKPDEFIAIIQEQLSSIHHYNQEAGFYYTIPKSEWVDRYMVYLPFKELVIRYAFVQVIADIYEWQMIPNCFANRLSSNENYLTEDFATQSWPAFCGWQKECVDKYSKLVVSDLTSFFDCVNHNKLLEIIAHRMGISVSDPFLTFFAKVLNIPIMTADGSHRFIQRQQGLLTGPECEGILANIYLSELDAKISALDDIDYGRYVDDIKIYGNDRTQLKSAFNLIQSELRELNLNLNASKTKFLDSEEEIIKLYEEEVMFLDEYNTPSYDTEEVHEYFEADEIEADELFTEREYDFDRTSSVESVAEAKEFCQTLHQMVDPDEFTKKDIANLILIFKKYPAAAKSAAWLFIETMRKGDEKEKEMARKFIFIELFKNENIHLYAKSRVIHHLVKPRWKGRTLLKELMEDGCEEEVLEIFDNPENIEFDTLLTIYLEELYKIYNADASLKDIKEAMRKDNSRPNVFVVKAINTIYAEKTKKEDTDEEE